MELQLVPVGSGVLVNDSRLIAVSDERGKFAFRDVPVGTYTLSVKFNDLPTELSPYSTFFFPSTENRRKAEVFEIRPDTVFQALVFRLPPELVKTRITGRVVWASDGKPVIGAWIACWDLDFDFVISFGRIFSRLDGTFAIDVYSGRRYQFGSMALDGPPEIDTLFRNDIKLLGVGESMEFRLDKVDPTLEIKLDKPHELERKRLIEKYSG